MQNNIELDISVDQPTVEQPEVKPVKKEPVKAKQPEPQVQPQVVGMTIEDIAKAFQLIQQQTNKQHYEAQAAIALENKMRNVDLAGLASAEFVKKMEKEIEEGRYYNFLYLPQVAEKFGNPYPINISGYKMFFHSQQYTKVPNVLLNEVIQRFNVTRGNSNSLPEIEVRDYNTGKVDRAASVEASQKINDALPGNHKMII